MERKYENKELQHAYEMGVDKSKNGANTTNCAFHLFSSFEKKEAWEIGVKEGSE
jgi:hypothetical protein